jgi:predicted transglutaminase-like cysteine proteinase
MTVATTQGLAYSIAAHSKRHPPSFWTAWMSKFVVIFLLVLPEITSARTDFDRMEQLAAAEYGQTAAATIKAWRAMIEKNRTQPDLIKLERANIFVNDRVSYASDRDIWGVEDYWTTPLEVFGKGRGDCEDYAIAKYVSLLLMDVPVQRLRLVYARARMGSQTVAHLVLSYYETPMSDPLILDNLVDAILPAKRRTDLFPVFSFNHEGLWMGGEQSPTGDPTARLSRWRDVLQRMRREGIDPSLTRPSGQSPTSWKQPKFRPSQHNTANSQSPSKVMAKHQASPKKIASASTKLKAKTAKYQPSPQRIAKR